MDYDIAKNISIKLTLNPKIMTPAFLNQINHYKNSGAELYSFKHNPQINTIEVVYRWNEGVILPTNPPQTPPDRVWKEIYGIHNGNLILKDVIQGTHVQEKNIPEQIKFE